MSKIPPAQISIYPLSGTSSVTDTTWSGTTYVDSNTFWTTQDTSSGIWISHPTTTIPGTTTYYTLPSEGELVMQAFRDLGLEAFPEEIQLVTQYMARYKRPLQKEVEEWFPIFARRRIVE
jgi:hypothetical protein